MNTRGWAEMLLLLLLLLLDVSASPPGGYQSGNIFYADPLFDGAHDAELVWHHGEQSWWLLYLQNKFNVPVATSTDGTDLGLASSRKPDLTHNH